MCESTQASLSPHERPTVPLVSVVTVVYNAEDVIGETIESVLEQTYPAVEYVVVDGESTDDYLVYSPTARGAYRHSRQ